MRSLAGGCWRVSLTPVFAFDAPSPFRTQCLRRPVSLKSQANQSRWPQSHRGDDPWQSYLPLDDVRARRPDKTYPKHIMLTEFGREKIEAWAEANGLNFSAAIRPWP